MKKISTLFCIVLFSFNTSILFAGNKCEVILSGNHSPKSFKMAPNVKEGDYLPNTIIFKVKSQYRQNCKGNSVDNLLPLQDFFQNVGFQNLVKMFPNEQVPSKDRNELGQKLVDITLIYSFKFNSSLSIEKVINGMLSLGYFEYVEPWYVPKVTLTPNDPNLPNQYHLLGTGVLGTGSINAENAWNIQTGNPNVVIGLTDTGTEFTHPDLAANVYQNPGETGLDALGNDKRYNGIDDDGDGYIDDYRGWDVGMNDNDATYQGNNHGVATSGDADAVTNNGVGVASPGFNCKYMMCKIADSTGALVAAYQGIQWLANYSEAHGHGKITVISNSWGGSGGGAFGQDIINYAAINKNILICASAGNNGAQDIVYPSSYNNVYRVSASTATDVMAGFSSYGVDVDWAAPGNNIYSTVSGATWGYDSGTSMACPISAGTAGIVESQLNYIGTGSGFQLGEKIKQTCTPMTSDAQYNAGMLGKGRIDMYKALTQAAKSIIVNPVTVTDKNSNLYLPGDTLDISGVFTNYLDPCSSAATATLSVVSGPGTVINGSFNIGALATLGLDSNTITPFTAKINTNAAVNADIKFKIHIVDGTFTGDTYFDVLVNVDYINIAINDVFTSITSKGRIGYNLDAQTQGLGFQYQVPNPAADLLYEMSLMIGVSSTQVSDMFRGASVGDTDNVDLQRVQKYPAIVSDFDAGGKFNDAHSNTSSPIPVEVRHYEYAWSTAPYNKFVIVKYHIKNTGASTLNNLYAGIMADWDVPNANASQDKGAYDALNKMGYCWYVNGPLYAGIKLLSSTAPANSYIVDNVATGNGGVDVTTASGFTTAMKYTVLSTPRNNDGYPTAGGDVMDCLSSGPFMINAGDSVEVAFALIGGDNLSDLQVSACAAQNKYDNTCAMGVNDLETNNFWMFNYPNPATNSVNINYNVVGYNKAAIRIMNTLGEVVMTLDNIPVGRNNLTVDVSKLSSGNYFYQMKAGEATLTKKITIAK